MMSRRLQELEELNQPIVGGWNTYYLINKDIDKDLLCAICQNVLREPKDCTECEKTFCSECLARANNRCPLRCTRGYIKKAHKSVRGLLEKIEFKCFNFQKGCAARVKYTMLEQHPLECKFREVTCKYQGCNQTMAKALIEDHERACEHGPVVCNMCSREVVKSRLDEHEERECMKAIVPCK